MNVKLKIIFGASNPFLDAYIHSDFLGKLIFIGLVLLSICSWVILIQKIWITYRARKHSAEFYATFQMQKNSPLSLDLNKLVQKKQPNPFSDLYEILKKQTIEILNKNRKFGKTPGRSTDGSFSEEQDQNVAYLSEADVQFVDTHLMSGIASQVGGLEKNLFVLSTVVSLGPFLGLLGTVWGILTTFSELQMQSSGSTNQLVLGGLSLALATTVLGLLDAIPALIGYNYLKNTISSFETEMEGFSTEILAAVEMQYRKVNTQ